MTELTRAQKKWLKILRERGFVETGGWGNGQRNRPLFALVDEGLAVLSLVRRGAF